jgi:hypothetical protein
MFRNLMTILALAIIGCGFQDTPEVREQSEKKSLQRKATWVLEYTMFIRDTKGRCFVLYSSPTDPEYGSLAPIDCTKLTEDEIVQAE